MPPARSNRSAPRRSRRSPAQQPALLSLRGHGGRLDVVAAELGAHSPSNFYKGLSGNDIVDHGGLFVSTYKLPKLGQPVRIRVSLPGGYEFEANAIVRWRSEPSDGGSDAPPGFGAQFTEITPEARQLVYRYTRNREPMFHDDLVAGRLATCAARRRRSRRLDWRGLPSLCFFVALVVAAVRARVDGRAHAANDPKLLWKTIETKHFRINYYSTEDEVAEHVATLAEAIYAAPRCPHVGWAPSERHRDRPHRPDRQRQRVGDRAAVRRHPALRDGARRHVAARRRRRLVPRARHARVHAHPAHRSHHGHPGAHQPHPRQDVRARTRCSRTGCSRGSPSTRRARETSGGRLRSSMWNMWMRADVLEDNVATLDQFSNIPRRWPQGNIWYLYGSFFMQWIAETYGEQAIRAMDRRLLVAGHPLLDQPVDPPRDGQHVRGALRVVGRLDAARLRRARQTPIRARGLREGIRRHAHGQHVRAPAVDPARTRGRSTRATSLFYADDGHTSAGAVGAATRSRRARPRHRLARGRAGADRSARTASPARRSCPTERPSSARATSSTTSSSSTTCSSCRRTRRARRGLEGKRIRWSEGWRALDPSVSPDGRRVVFTTNHRGTTYLMMADIVPRPDGGVGHALANVRPLVRSAMFDQAYTPRWSPDNRHVAYSSWPRGGYRDIRIVDARDGSLHRRDARPRHRRRPVVLGGRSLAVLPLGPHGRA